MGQSVWHLDFFWREKGKNISWNNALVCKKKYSGVRYINFIIIDPKSKMYICMFWWKTQNPGKADATEFT
jgi:hypothetical protein